MTRESGVSEMLTWVCVEFVLILLLLLLLISLLWPCCLLLMIIFYTVVVNKYSSEASKGYL